MADACDRLLVDAYDQLLDKALVQAWRRGSAEHLLREWLDLHDKPCRYDHHGYCQEHFLEDDCIVKRTREFLGEEDD